MVASLLHLRKSKWFATTTIRRRQLPLEASGTCIAHEQAACVSMIPRIDGAGQFLVSGDTSTGGLLLGAQDQEAATVQVLPGGLLQCDKSTHRKMRGAVKEVRHLDLPTLSLVVQ